MTGTSEVLVSDVSDSVGIIELSRPQKLNCLSDAMIAKIMATLTEFERNRTVRSVLLRAKGRTFCAGADLEEVKALRLNREALVQFLERGHALMTRIEESPLPIVAAVQGACLAGGLELILSCDVVFAAESARFGDQHAQYGLFPGWGATQRLPRIIGPRRALDLMLSAAWLSASVAGQWGLVNHVVADDSLQELAMKYCKVLGGRSRPAIAAMKKSIRNVGTRDLPAGLRDETETAVGVLSGNDAAEGLSAFEARREPQFTA
jgi:enoyl-CoA hydratase/carnithine racemase